MFLFSLFVSVLVVKAFGKEVDDIVQYEGIGCYADNMSRPLPTLLKNFRDNINWEEDWPKFDRVIAKCAKLAYSKGYYYFAIQYYGECWTGLDAYKRFYEKGESKRCVHGVGEQWTNYVYMIITPDRLECSSSVYRELNESNRAVDVKIYRNYLCDNNLITPGKKSEWFRFTGGAGNTLAMKAPYSQSCSTLSGGWLKGDLPKEKNTAVERKACFPKVPFLDGIPGDPCEKQVTIKVRNCGHFFVYELKPEPKLSCKYRYCGDTISLKDY